MKGISPVVATVLLIALAVIASVTAWFWISSYTVKPALGTTTLSGYVVTGVYKNLSKDGCTGLDVKNTGGQAINNVAFYLKDYLTGKTVGSNGTDPPYPAYINLTNINPGASVFFSLNKLGGGAWAETNISDEPTLVYFAAIGDANNDGKQDVVVGMESITSQMEPITNEVRMYENKTGKWVETNISDEPNGVFSVAVGDANNDGKNEVVIGMDSTTNEVRMYENKTGKWIETNISDVSTQVLYVAVGDANNDGKNEVVIGILSEPTINELRMYENKTGKWVETNISDTPNDVNSIAIGDANNDGKNETVVGIYSGPTTNEVRMYENKTGGWIETNISDTPASVYSVAIGDANNDGLNDVVIAAYTTTGVRMYENKTGKWVETNISDISEVDAIAVGDANNDGNKEIVVGVDSTTNRVRMYENKTGKWVETNISDVPDDVWSVVIGDMDNDGSNEIVIGSMAETNELRGYEITTATTTVPLGTYILRTSSPGFSDIRFTCA
jgi:flagellin-like protein